MEFSWQELCLPPKEFEFGPNAFPRYTPISQVPVKRQKIVLSELFINSCVQTGAFLKSSNIPDTLCDMTDSLLQVLMIMEQNYGLLTGLKGIAIAIISIYLNFLTIFITGVAKGIITYHKTPIQKETEPLLILSKGTVKLNVGGQTFVTFEANLKGYLKILASKGHFIDRDPTLFKHVLNHLRGIQTWEYLGKQQLHELLVEARFYEIDTLSNLIQKKINSF